MMNQLTFFADASAAGNAMRTFIAPTITTLCVIAGLAAVGFLVHGGYQMITSSGQPDRLDSAKTTVRNALLGLIVVLAVARWGIRGDQQYRCAIVFAVFR